MSSAKQQANEYHVWFDSLAELMADIKTLPQQHNDGRAQRFLGANHTGYTNEHWFLGQRSGVDVLQKMSDGWPEVLEALQPKIAELRTEFQLDSVSPLQIEVRRRKRGYGDHGDTIDMKKVWGGQLDKAWERPVRVPRMTSSQRYATLYLDVFTTHFTNSYDTLWSAAAMMCCIDVLTRMGVNTELWVGTSTKDTFVSGPRHLWTGVKVKEFVQPLNEERTASMLSAASYRSMGFLMALCAPYRCGAGMGYALGSGLLQPLKDRLDSGERVFRVGQCLNMQDAKLEMQKVINQLRENSHDH